MPPGFTAPGMTAQPDASLIELAVYAAAGLAILILFLTILAIASLPIFFAALGIMEVGLRVVQNAPDPVGKYSKLGGLVFRSLRRNLLRTALTYEFDWAEVGKKVDGGFVAVGPEVNASAPVTAVDERVSFSRDEVGSARVFDTVGDDDEAG